MASNVWIQEIVQFLNLGKGCQGNLDSVPFPVPDLMLETFPAAVLVVD